MFFVNKLEELFEVEVQALVCVFKCSFFQYSDQFFANALPKPQMKLLLSKYCHLLSRVHQSFVVFCEINFSSSNFYLLSSKFHLS